MQSVRVRVIDTMFPTITEILRAEEFVVCTEVFKDGKWIDYAHLCYSDKGKAKWAMKLAHKVNGYIRIYTKGKLIATLIGSSTHPLKRVFSVCDPQGYHSDNPEYIFLDYRGKKAFFTHLLNYGRYEKEL